MTEINKQWHDKAKSLQEGVVKYSFTDSELENFKGFIYKRIDSEDILKKKLGVFYPTVINLLTDDALDERILRYLEVEYLSKEDILKLCLHLISEEESETKVYGDIQVTECLNYLDIESQEIVIREYWKEDLS